MLQSAREQLEESLPGTGGGRNPKDDLLVKFLFFLPLCVVLFCYYHSFLQVRCFTIIYSSNVNNKVFFFWSLSILLLVQTRTLCRSSLCDLIRHLHYKIRSNGALAYTNVSSSASINSTHQVSFLFLFLLVWWAQLTWPFVAAVVVLTILFMLWFFPPDVKQFPNGALSIWWTWLKWPYVAAVVV